MFLTCSFSSDKELRIKSTPLPLVSLRIMSSNDVSREFPIWLSVGDTIEIYLQANKHNVLF